MPAESHLIPPDQSRIISRRTLLSKFILPESSAIPSEQPTEENYNELTANREITLTRRSALINSARIAAVVALAPNPLSQILGGASEEYPIPFQFLGPTEQYRPIIANTKEVLPPKLPPAIAHRAGNSRLGIERAAKAGFSYAELSLSKPKHWDEHKDDLYAYHGKIYTAFGANVGVDITPNTVSFRLLPLKDAFSVAQKNGIGLCIEGGKADRGGLTENDLRTLHRLIQESQVPTIFFSTYVPEYMDMAKKIIGPDATYLKPIYSDEQFDTFLKQPEYGGSFFTNIDILHKHQAVIKSRQLKPIVNNVNTPEEALMVLGTGAAAGISGDAGLLQNLFCRELSGRLDSFKT